MCTGVYMPDGRALYGIRDLRAEGWSVDPGDIDAEDYEGPDDELCNCWVDVEAVLDRAGVTYEANPFGFDVAAGPVRREGE